MNMISKIETSSETSADTVPRTARWHKIAWAALPVVVIAGAWSVLQREGPAVAAMPAPTVTVAPPAAASWSHSARASSSDWVTQVAGVGRPA